MSKRGINKVILVGNLGNDPEVRYNSAGAAITSISVATSESWVDKSTGQKQEKSEWHKVVFFGKLAEIAGEYLKKGSQVYVEGKLQTKKYQDKQTGADKYSTSIVVDSFEGVMQMLGGKQEGQSNNSQPQQPQQPQQAQQQAPQQNYQSQPNQQQQAPQQSYQNQPNPKQQQQPAGDFNNSFDDGIPF